MKHVKRLWLPVFLVVSVCLNLYLLFFKEAPAAYVVSGDSLPQHIVSRYQVIQRNNGILSHYGYDPGAFTAWFLTSPELPEDIGFYCMTKLNREPKAYEPMVYQSLEEPVYLFTVQRSETEQEIVILSVDAQKQVYEVERLRDGPPSE
ncbi:hypothetical protein D1157_09150 [Anaerotruncus sp. X29]|uniref:hypothetical protein n=1 Tax=Anaerotruncus sp. G3(2012) TaxID=1235835 RepID=UPI0003368B0D|nr:hypothetical protein [Anaerotruncus sp. G3(2012)]EOS56469.1 hypothetical protein C814_02724 [Anaerotruncus sp. G3(2012)]MCI9160945.1 hypothetical protein [Anaerotruncus sp.]NCE75171.1 hypothetical protein [Anaerotruncus sp. X29]